MISWMLSGAACSRADAKVDYKSFPEPKQALPVAADTGPQELVLAGGCFWCVEGVFENIPGVTDVVSGYSGGTAETANYKRVCEGDTDHAEAVKLTYDPSKVSFGKLLKVFFSVAHDPTTLNRQGPDSGRQYRSAIFYANDEQRRVAEAYIAQLNDAKVFGDSKIVTALEPLTAFYPAEDYHQDYARLNPKQGYIAQQAAPKIEKAKKVAKEIESEPATQPGK